MTSATQTQQNYNGDNSNNTDGALMRGYLARFFNKELFINNLKRNKIFIIIITVVLGFSCPLIGYLAVFNGEPANQDLAEVLSTIVICSAVMFAVLLSLNAMGYTHGKISSIFYNSLPIKKTCLFTTQFVCGLVYFLVPLVPIYLITVVLFIGDSYAGTLTMGFIWAALLFILTYSFTTLAANISGTMFNSLIVLAYLNFYLISMLGMIIVFMSTFYNYTDPNFIFNEAVLTRTSPIIYYIWTIMRNNLDEFSAPAFIVTALGMILISAVFYTISLYLNKINKTENAGKSMNFKIFERIFKYSMLALTAIIGGTMFASMQRSGYVMFLFGILIFVFISFMLMNFIISGNIREVFKGLKNLGIFTAIACVVMFTFALDVFGIDKYMPNINSVESVSIYSYGRPMYDNSYSRQSLSGYQYSQHNDYNITVSDPAEIAIMYDIFDTAMNNSQEYDYYTHADSENLMYNQPYNFSFYDISFRLKNGVVVKKKIPYTLVFNTQEDRDKFSSLITDFISSDGFKKAYFSPIFDDNFIDSLYNSGTNVNINLSVYYRTDEMYKDSSYISSYAMNGEILLNATLNASQLAEVFDNARSDIMLIDGEEYMASIYYPYSIVITIRQWDSSGDTTSATREIYMGVNNRATRRNFPNLMDYLENNFNLVKIN